MKERDVPAEDMDWSEPEPPKKLRDKFRKHKAESGAKSVADEAFAERQAEGLRCLAVMNPNQLAELVSTAGAEESELTALARASDWTEPFLLTLARRGTLMAAAREAGVSRARVYELMDECPTFRRAVEVAKEEFVEYLEDVAVRRAEGGSDRMLEVLLRAASPKYRSEAQQAVNVNVGAPIVVDVVADLQAAQPVDESQYP